MAAKKQHERPINQWHRRRPRRRGEGHELGLVRGGREERDEKTRKLVGKRGERPLRLLLTTYDHHIILLPLSKHFGRLKAAGKEEGTPCTLENVGRGE